MLHVIIKIGDNVNIDTKIIEKAKLEKGLTHKEAAVLLACNIKEKNDIYEKDITYSCIFNFRYFTGIF